MNPDMQMEYKRLREFFLHDRKSPDNSGKSLFTDQGHLAISIMMFVFVAFAFFAPTQKAAHKLDFDKMGAQELAKHYNELTPAQQNSLRQKALAQAEATRNARLAREAADAKRQQLINSNQGATQ